MKTRAQYRKQATNLCAAMCVAALGAAVHVQADAQTQTKTPRPLAPAADIKTPASESLIKATKPGAKSVTRYAGNSDAPRKSVDLPPALADIKPPMFDRLIWDMAADGSLWVRGSNYKARFAADGMTFFPFTGSNAPHNEPVRFALTEMSVAGKTTRLAAAPAVVVSRQGDRVSIDRGDVTEMYDVSLASVEQLFVFDARPAAGDITLRVHADTAMGKSVDVDGLSFAASRGGVNYSSAIALDVDGDSVAAATSLRNGDIEIVVPAAFAAEAAWPLVVDPIISGFSAEVSSSEAVVADVAFDADNLSYFVTWELAFSETDGDVYCDTFDGNGNSKSTLASIDITNDNWRNPSCANNNIADNFLVAAEVGVAPSRVIKARSLPADSPASGTVFTISGSEQGDKRNPAVGGDPHTLGPTYYCIAWQRDLSGTDTDIHARLASANASPIGTTPIFLSNSGATLDRKPAISKSNGLPPFDTQAWTIAWERNFLVGDSDIYAAQLAWDGAIIDSFIEIDLSSTDDHNPSVSTILDEPANGERPYMVVYDELTADFQRDIYACVFAGDTIITGANLSELQGVLRAQDQHTPVVDSDGSKFIVAHAEMYEDDPQDYDILVSSFCLLNDAIATTEYRRVMAGHLYLENSPAIASVHAAGGEDFMMLLSWQYDSPVGNGNIGAGFYRSRPVCGCPADVTPDYGVVNIDDLLVIITWWGGGVANIPADLNGDYYVDINDLLMVISSWGPCPG